MCKNINASKINSRLCKTKTALVTGGAGFIGSHVVDVLINSGYRVVIIDNLSSGNKRNINTNAKFYRIDIQNKGISEIFKKERFEYVFHLAAQVNLMNSIKNPILDSKTNIIGSLNVLENAYKNKVKKVIFSSSCAIYGEENIVPTSEACSPKYLSPYGINKLTIEHYLKYYKTSRDMNYLVLRLSNVYGPRQMDGGESGVIALFINKIIRAESPIIYGNGMQTRDFIFVKDVAKAFLMGCENSHIGELNIGTGIETSINDLVRTISEVVAKEINPIYRLPKEIDQKRSCLDCSRAKKILNWIPEYFLKDGLRHTVSWYGNK